MTDDIDYQLALAIGWRESDVLVTPTGAVLCFEVVTLGPPLKIGGWRKFDHTDPVVADALVERYRLTVMPNNEPVWVVWAGKGRARNASRHRAIALAVIALEAK